MKKYLTMIENAKTERILNGILNDARNDKNISSFEYEQIEIVYYFKAFAMNFKVIY